MIRPQTYNTIATKIDEAQKQVIDTLGNLFSMRRNLYNNEVSVTDSEKGQLLITIDETYNLILNENYIPSKSLLDVVHKLQLHVSTHYGNVNSFLSDNNILVGSSFADLSASVGYQINPENIE